MWKGKNLVTENWKPLDQTAEKEAVLTITSCIPKLPDTGGLQLLFTAKKPANFILNQARLTLEGDSFWKA